jgi:hypothetical protein
MRMVDRSGSVISEQFSTLTMTKPRFCHVKKNHREPCRQTNGLASGIPVIEVCASDG